ncbi:MAG TPA: DNA-3-methyladenine glycosylase 2 family protein, partial [Planctomycetaceae bacterium]|nr:DNA-3-methyladenine glycosylase 2 family protein [Planctomycetaceae bacterium]
MRELIAQVGPFRLKLETNRFRALARAIVAQQISTKAARSIQKKLEGLLPGTLCAENLSRLTPVELRSAGLSPQKIGYLLDLSEKVLSKQVRLRRLSNMSDADVIQELVQVKGIGTWTAQMFLIFSLGRLDVFAPDDLGLRSAIRNLYGLEALPDKPTAHRYAEPWRPYASVASWYCWRSF